MSSVATKTHYTPADLLTMPDGARYELVDGKLVERNMSALSSYVAGVMCRYLGNHCQNQPLGWVFPEGTSYQCFADEPAKVRKPDTSFVRLERLSIERAFQEGHLTLSPDLAVEVVSPNDLYYQVEEKVEEWLSAGVQLVWVINPRPRWVRVFRSHGADTTLGPEEELTGEDVVPGFRCRVADLFQPPPGVASNS